MAHQMTASAPRPAAAIATFGITEPNVASPKPIGWYAGMIEPPMPTPSNTSPNTPSEPERTAPDGGGTPSEPRTPLLIAPDGGGVPSTPSEPDLNAPEGGGVPNTPSEPERTAPDGGGTPSEPDRNAGAGGRRPSTPDWYELTEGSTD